MKLKDLNIAVQDLINADQANAEIDVMLEGCDCYGDFNGKIELVPNEGFEKFFLVGRGR